MTGGWTDQVKQQADRFTLGAKLGCDVRLAPDAAAAVGEVIVNMARMLDATEQRCVAAERLIAAQQAERESFGRLTRSLWLSAAWLIALLIVAWLLP